MQKHSSFIYFAFIILLSLLYGCAQQVMPSGGPKDVKPPQLVKAIPDNFSKHFNSRIIVLTFNKFFALADPSNQIFISPALNHKPDIGIKGKSIVIKLKDTLERNTTYTIYFGTAIKDIHENNVLKNFQYVFSTGDYIDSFRIQGLLKSVLDNKPVSGAMLMLYKDLDDSAVVKHKPDYFIRSGEQGDFRLDHIKGGEYKVFALQDMNGDYKYESDELLGFPDSLAMINDTSATFLITMFKALPQKNSVLKATCPVNGKIRIAFARRPDSLQIRMMKPVSDIRAYTFDASMDTVTCIIDPAIKDSAVLYIADKTFSDTESVMLRERRVSKDTTRKVKVTFTSNFIGGKTSNRLLFGSNIMLKPSLPVKTISDSKTISIRDLADSTKKIPVSVNMIFDKFSHEQFIQIKAGFKSTNSYRMKIPAKMFFDFDGNTNDSTVIKFIYTDETDIGSLNVTFTNEDSTKQYFILLMNDDGKIIDKIIFANKKQISFSNLAPGNYHLKVVEDLNRNGEWDSGNYWKHLQPENIYIYGKDITVRSNWDLTITMPLANNLPPKEKEKATK